MPIHGAEVAETGAMSHADADGLGLPDGPRLHHGGQIRIVWAVKSVVQPDGDRGVRLPRRTQHHCIHAGLNRRVDHHFVANTLEF